MPRDVILLLAGGTIGLVSSLITALVNYLLQGRRLRERLEREDQLRQEEREREDRLHHEVIERDRRLYLDSIDRQNRLLAIDALWRDMERLREILKDLPPEEEHRRHEFEDTYDNFSKRREDLMRDEGLLLMEP